MVLNTEGFHSEMSKEEVLSWFASKLNRRATSADIYSLGKDLYHAGQYPEATKALEVYISVPGKQLSGVHLLGYAYYMSGALDQAISMFKQCVNDGFDADWQLLIEIQQELDEKSS